MIAHPASRAEGRWIERDMLAALPTALSREERAARDPGGDDLMQARSRE